MVNSDLRALVLRMDVGGDSIWIRLTEGSPSTGGKDPDSDDSCETCCSIREFVPAGTMVYGTEVYLDRGLTSRNFQTGGDLGTCADCWADGAIACYNPDLVEYPGKKAGSDYWSDDVKCAIEVDFGALVDRTEEKSGGC